MSTPNTNTTPAAAAHEEGVFKGKLAVREVTGKRGAFNVGTLVTRLGEFAIIQKELDGFAVGNYIGRFHVETIKLRHYTIRGANVSEIQAVLRSFIIAPFDNETGEVGEPVEVVASAAAPAGQKQKPAKAAKASAAPVADAAPVAQKAEAPASKAAQTPKPAPVADEAETAQAVKAPKAEAPAPVAPAAGPEPEAGPESAFVPTRHRLIPTRNAAGGTTYVGIEVDANGNEVAAKAEAPAPVAPKAASSGVTTFVFGRAQLSGDKSGRTAEQVVADAVAKSAPAPAVAPAVVPAEPAKTVMTVAEEQAFRMAQMDRELFGEEIYQMVVSGAEVFLDKTVDRSKLRAQHGRLKAMGYAPVKERQSWAKPVSDAPVAEPVVAPAAEPLTVAEQAEKAFFGDEVYQMITSGAETVKLDPRHPRFAQQCKRMGKAGLGYQFHPSYNGLTQVWVKPV